jgi:hypothetical protein
MKTNDFIEDYRSIIESSTDEELVAIYFQQEGYEEEYVSLLVEELHARGLPPEKLTDEAAANALLISKKSDEELYEIYTHSSQYSQEWRALAEAEAMRRGLSVDVVAKAKDDAELAAGIEGKHIVAGFIFCLLGGIIGLIIGFDYAFSTRTNADGECFYKYDRATRTSGKWMLVLFAVVVTIFIAAKLNE